MARSSKERLEDIRQAIIDVHEFIEGFDQDRFLLSQSADRKTYRAVSNAFSEIGETVNSLPAAITDKYPEIEWRGIAGIRNRLNHEYFKIDPAVIWQTIEGSDLDQLFEIVEAELASEFPRHKD